MIQRVFIETPPCGARNAVRHRANEFRIRRQHQLGLRRAEKFRGQAQLRLNGGGGAKLKPGWINIDLAATADLSLDVREPLPFEDDSCSMICAEHFPEHLDDWDDKQYVEHAKKRWHPRVCATERERSNCHFRQDGEHRFADDQTTRVRALTRVGFQEVQRRGHDVNLDGPDREMGIPYGTACKAV